VEQEWEEQESEDSWEAHWEGLEASEDVGRALGDLARVGDRLVQVRALRAEPRSEAHIRNAVDGVVLAISALVASGDIKCNLARPPEDVDTRPRGPAGAMITKCFHQPAHCWDGIGNRIDPCP
jgi:hypothetical protein